MNLLELFIEKVSQKEPVYIRGLSTFLRNLIIKLRKKGVRQPQLERMLNLKLGEISWWIYANQGLQLKKLQNLNKIFKKLLKESVNYKGSYFGFKASIYSITIPKLTRRLSYLVGYLYGDGTLSSYKKNRLEFYDISKGFLEYIASIVRELFGLNKYTIKKDKKSNCYCLRFNCKILVMFFNKLFEVPIGKKKNLHIPTLIKDSKFIKEFISGLFDAEGHISFISHYGYRITITQYDKLFLEEIKKVLEKYRFLNLRIRNYRQRDFELLISGKKNFYRFVSLFSIKHLDKILQIQKAVEGKPTIKRFRLTSVRTSILEQLKDGNTTRQIAERLNMRTSLVWRHLCELEHMGKVKKTKLPHRKEVIWAS